MKYFYIVIGGILIFLTLITFIVLVKTATSFDENPIDTKPFFTTHQTSDKNQAILMFNFPCVKGVTIKMNDSIIYSGNANGSVPVPRDQTFSWACL